MTSRDSAVRSVVLPPSTLLVRPRPWLMLAAAPSDPPYRQQALPLTYSMPNGLDANPRGGAPTKTRSAGDPQHASPSQWAARFLQAVVEVVCSDRPLSQLARWTAPTVFDTIAQAQRSVAAGRRDTVGRAARPYVASVHVCQVQPDAAEVAARVVGGPRSRALAARLDYRQDRWTCTALQFG